MALKKTSEVVQISEELAISSDDINAPTTKTVNLQLSPLDLEVFIVTAVDIEYQYDMSGDLSKVGNGALIAVSVSTTQRTTMGDISDSNVITSGRARVGDANSSFNQSTSIDSPNAHMDYIAVIATNDYHLQGYFVGLDSPNTTRAYVRVYGYRAKADAATYAALVQSEQLSA